jgi:dihydroorotase
VVALKLYPAGATTNSDAGVTDIRKTYATLEAMQREGLLLLVHGEVTDPEIDLFDREAVFIDRVMQPLRRDFPELKVVFEHITTREAAQYVAASRAAHRGHHHRAPPALQPQRDLHRRPAPALLLPAGAQARGAPPGAGGGGHLGQPASSSAPTARRTPRAEGACQRSAAPAASPRLRAGAVCRGLRGRRRAGQAGRLCQPPRPDFYGLPRNTGTRDAAARALDLPETLPFGDAPSSRCAATPCETGMTTTRLAA